MNTYFIPRRMGKPPNNRVCQNGSLSYIKHEYNSTHKTCQLRGRNHLPLALLELQDQSHKQHGTGSCARIASVLGTLASAAVQRKTQPPQSNLQTNFGKRMVMPSHIAKKLALQEIIRNTQPMDHIKIGSNLRYSYRLMF
jgi:hypothetical protein